MALYMSKKISIVNGGIVTSVSFNQVDGFIAAGGNDGTLKVLKLDNHSNDNSARGITAANSLSMNQLLDGHKAAVTVLSWNNKFQKLTSGDVNGNIIVWMIEKGVWYEEMVNSRTKSQVTGMKWTNDGRKICIAYNDGCVIVGSVEGSRLWSKELKMKISSVEWSPNGKTLLFIINSTEVHIYNQSGNFLSQMVIYGIEKVQSGSIVGLEWYSGAKGYLGPETPSLALIFENSICQLMKNEFDGEPIVFRAHLKSIIMGHWNDQGTILGLLGMTVEGKCALEFYNPSGDWITTLCMNGKQITSFGWDGGSVRLVVGIDSFIYIANYRPVYKWCYFSETVVYSYNKPNSYKLILVFWNIKTGERHSKVYKNIAKIVAAGDLCCLIVSNEEEQSNTVYLCNSIGTQLDSKTINMFPLCVQMTGSHVVIACDSAFYVWQFKNLRKMVAVEVAESRRSGTEKLYHVDDVPSGVGGEIVNFNKISMETKDTITALCISDKFLLLGRKSGQVNQYAIPEISLQNKFTLKAEPKLMQLNSTSTCLAYITIENFLQFTSVPTKGTNVNMESNDESITEKLNQFNQKDIWDFKWAEDNDNMFVAMERTKLHIFKNFEIEESIVSSGYLCEFKDLTIKSVFLDEILVDPENLPKEIFNDYISNTESKSLRDCRNILRSSGIKETIKFIEENAHPKLWRLLAEECLEKLNLGEAETAYARACDYAGIQFVKRLKSLQSENLKKSEVLIRFSHFEEAERLYLKMDRKDLAVALRRKLGDYDRVLKLLKSGGGGNDFQLNEALNLLGDSYFDKQEWQLGIQCYSQSKNIPKLLSCYHRLDNYSAIKDLTPQLPENDKLLPIIGQLLASAGMWQEAVDAYIKCNQPQQAIDVCANLNQWNLAISLAKQYGILNVDTKLIRYARTLIDSGKIFEAAELYRKADHYMEAAKLLYKLVQDETHKKSNPLLIKKLYTMVGRLVEDQNESMRATQRTKIKKRGEEAAMALASLLEQDRSGDFDGKVVENAWRGAEAYHLYILSQKQIYQGNYEAAVKTSLALMDFEDILNPIDIYSFIALSAMVQKNYTILSKALSKLESMESLTDQQREQYEELAIEILYHNKSKEDQKHKEKKMRCTTCNTEIPDTSTSCNGCGIKFPTCLITGSPINAYSFWMCPLCKRKAGEKEIARCVACPLCHNPNA